MFCWERTEAILASGLNSQLWPVFDIAQSFYNYLKQEWEKYPIELWLYNVAVTTYLVEFFPGGLVNFIG